MLGRRIATQLRPRVCLCATNQMPLGSTRSLAMLGTDYSHLANAFTDGARSFSSVHSPSLAATQTATPTLPMDIVMGQMEAATASDILAQVQQDCYDLLDSAIWLASVKRKRKVKMNKHKLKKLRRKTRMSTKKR
jgi:hypothetical protein